MDTGVSVCIICEYQNVSVRILFPGKLCVTPRCLGSVFDVLFCRNSNDSGILDNQATIGRQKTFNILRPFIRDEGGK